MTFRGQESNTAFSALKSRFAKKHMGTLMYHLIDEKKVCMWMGGVTIGVEGYCLHNYILPTHNLKRYMLVSLGCLMIIVICELYQDRLAQSWLRKKESVEE